jgi:hypothetical protein
VTPAARTTRARAVTPPVVAAETPATAALEHVKAAEVTPAAQIARKTRTRKAISASPAPAAAQPAPPLDFIAPSEAPAESATRTPLDDAAAPPTAAPETSEPTSPPALVDAPGWPRQAELIGGKRSDDAPSPTPDRDPAGGSDDGFRPYRAVYEAHARRREGRADASDGPPSWADRAASAWDASEGDSREIGPEITDPEQRRITRRAKSRNGEARTARAREIAEKVQRALGDDDLAPDFGRVLASALAEYAQDEADRLVADPLGDQER